MPNPLLVVTALGLALGLTACDQGAQEQAQTPNQEQQQDHPAQAPAPAPAPPPPADQQQPATPPAGESGGSQ